MSAEVKIEDLNEGDRIRFWDDSVDAFYRGTFVEVFRSVAGHGLMLSMRDWGLDHDESFDNSSGLWTISDLSQITRLS